MSPLPIDAMLSQAVEDYLKTIYKLQRDGAASTSDIARTLDVSAASVTNMVKRLAQHGLAEHQSYRGVTLTPAGNKIALEIIRHHRLLELYLKEVMGYGWEQLHDEAEHLEHHISEEFESKIEAMLGFPTHDPHGDPIPTRDGHVEAVADAPLTQVSAGQAVVVRRVSDADPELLHYLEELGLMPRAEVVVVEKAPFNGPLDVRIGEETKTVGFAVASNVFVVVS
ncbi:MAG: metal-dependent transcriptional regulator [Rhodothermales bacterium]|nr:metal-dependent transcriptional regulator [Rhodothermales bacterium]